MEENFHFFSNTENFSVYMIYSLFFLKIGTPSILYNNFKLAGYYKAYFNDNFYCVHLFIIYSSSISKIGPCQKFRHFFFDQ